ncbi:MAG: WD40 repeat protein, partial [Saprospiraceae bacterium]
MKEAGKIVVSSDFYGGGSGIDNILNDYYETEIQKIGNEEEQNLARKLIEEGLIIDGSRVSVSEAGIISQYKIPVDLLNRLRESRIIRAETTHLGKAYEVSHDTLVSPILKSYEKRRKKEEKDALAKKLKEEHEALIILSKKQRRAYFLAALGFLLFFIALIALAWAVKKNTEAKTQTRIAKSNALTAHSIFETQNNNNVTQGFGLAKAALDIDDNTEARKGLFSVCYKSTGEPAHYFYVRDLNCQSKTLLSAYYSPLANYIIANSWNKKACLMDKEGILIRTFDINNKKPIKRSFFSRDEKYLLTLTNKKTAEIWELGSLTTSSEPVFILEGHTENLTGAAFSSDGQKILTYAEDGKVLLWNSNWKEAKQINDTEEIISYANFSTDGNYILTAQTNGDFQIRDSLGSVLKNVITHPEKNLNIKIYDISFSPDSRYFAIATSLEIVQIWNWKGQLVTVLKGHKALVKDVDWSPDSKYIATASPDNTAKIWNLHGDIVANITGHNATVYTVNFSPDGTNLLTGSVESTAKVWTLEGDLVATLSGHFEAVKGAEYAPDGNRILTFSEDDSTVKEWIRELNQVTDIPVASEEVFKGKFSPDGSKIITCGSLIAMLYDLDYKHQSIQQIARLDQHTKAVIYASFSPDNDFIATASADNTAKIWNLKGELLADLTGHSGQIERI